MNKKYTQIIQTAKTISGLEQIKEDFLLECKKHEQKIKVSNIISEIDNFCTAKHVFESIVVPLMNKKGSKGLINAYIKTIKENKSLRTLYAYHEGLNENKTPDSKKFYITEALAISNPINHNEYVKGIGDIVGFISEGFKMLGDEYVLENVAIKPELKQICESLLFLSTTKKNIVNLNEYMAHVDNVTNTIAEAKKEEINTDLTLSEIVNEMKGKQDASVVDMVFNTDNKENTFNEVKSVCLEMISKQKNTTQDTDIYNKLNEMETKLSKKEYAFETFTKDMLYMTELQEVLK